MIIFSIIILIVAKALPGLNTHISSTHITRITSIVFLFAGALTLNILKIESIGSGIGIYSGFFQVTTISQLIEIFLFMIGGGILIAWPLFIYLFKFFSTIIPIGKRESQLILGGRGSSTNNKIIVPSPLRRSSHRIPLALDKIRTLACCFSTPRSGSYARVISAPIFRLTHPLILNGKFSITKKNFVSLNLIHTSAIVYSDNTRRGVLEEIASISEERLSTLQLIKYKEKLAESDMSDIVGGSISTYRENFPWLIDTDGKIIDFNKSIELFDGVKLISHYLEQRYNVGKELISDIKITELLEPFKDNNNITVLELFNHVGKIYNKDKNNLLKNLITESENISVTETAVNITNFKPLGVFGDKTLNDVAVGLLELKWDIIRDSAKVTVHAAPLTMNLISFSLILKGYMKYVHNRPYDSGPQALKIEAQKFQRRRNLALFTIFGAPMAIFSIKYAAIGLKNVINIDFSTSPPSLTPEGLGGGEGPNNKDISNNSFLLLIHKLFKKIQIPLYLRIVCIFLILNVVVLKLLGYSIFSLITDKSLLRNLIFVYFFLVTSYQLLNLYLAHIFASKKIKIPEILPDFLINWLKEFEIITLTEESIKGFKKTCYIELFVYLVMMVFFILILL
jgi:hypothetical protein